MVLPHVQYDFFMTASNPLMYMEQILYGPLHMYICSPHMWSVFMSYMTLLVPHTLYGIGIIGSSTCMYGPLTCMFGAPTCMIQCHWLLLSLIPYMEYVSDGPLLIWNRNRYHMVPPHVQYRYHMVPHMYIWSHPHVKCLHVLYDSYGPLIPHME